MIVDVFGGKVMTKIVYLRPPRAVVAHNDPVSVACP